MFLRGALKPYRRHASNFTAVAAALASLHETEAAAEMGEGLTEGQWSGLWPSLLDSLGRMGGEAAKRLLVEFVRDPKKGMKGVALAALTLIDAEAARTEADAILGGPLGAALPAWESKRIRQMLDRSTRVGGAGEPARVRELRSCGPKSRIPPAP